uniref:Uncharacterized protein n=1 Tax=Arundo donax TaxID=35708 RepID=A0A0A8Y2E1_ARUDO
MGIVFALFPILQYLTCCQHTSMINGKCHCPFFFYQGFIDKLKNYPFFLC